MNDAVYPIEKSCGVEIMDIKSLVKGAAAGAAAGMAICALTGASKSKKMSIRKDANRTIRAANSLWDDIKSLVM